MNTREFCALCLCNFSCFNVNLNRVNLLHFDVTDTSDIKATDHFAIMSNISTCQNPIIVMNFEYRGQINIPFIVPCW